MTRRVIVTGSRDWNSPESVWAALEKQLQISESKGVALVVVHGGATGADSQAAEWATTARSAGWDVIEEAHPADWSVYGNSAGPIRNRAMVELGADVCLAFPSGASKGTRHCMKVAVDAGIPVINYGTLMYY